MPTGSRHQGRRLYEMGLAHGEKGAALSQQMQQDRLQSRLKSRHENDMNSHLFWTEGPIVRHHHEARQNHRGVILWFTGLSGAGKSSLAQALHERLHQQGCRSTILDGDNVRHGLCADLGFSAEDRQENIRRVGEVAKLMLDAGLIVMTALISPFAADRDRVRQSVPSGDFVEIFCDTSLAVCEARDVKGLYQKARAGLLPQFTGISSPYEPPAQPELHLHTGEQALPVLVDAVWQYLLAQGIVREPTA